MAGILITGAGMAMALWGTGVVMAVALLIIGAGMVEAISKTGADMAIAILGTDTDLGAF